MRFDGILVNRVTGATEAVGLSELGDVVGSKAIGGKDVGSKFVGGTEVGGEAVVGTDVGGAVVGGKVEGLEGDTVSFRTIGEGVGDIDKDKCKDNENSSTSSLARRLEGQSM